MGMWVAIRRRVSDPTGRYVVGAGGQTYYPSTPPPSSAPTASPVRAAPPAPTVASTRNIGGATSGSSRERSIAYQLAFAVAAWRQYTDQAKSFADFAAGVWYLTDQNGNGDCFLCVDTISGTHSLGWYTKSAGRDEINDPTHSSDAEQRLLTSFVASGGAFFAVLAAKLARLANVHAILHIVLFTELPPCGECQAFFNKVFLPTMAAIGTALMNGPPALDPWPTGEIGIQFDVFAKDPAVTRGDYRQPITSPSDLLLTYPGEILFTGGIPDGTA